MPNVVVSLPFDRPGTRDFRLLQEASRLGEVLALLWSDQAIRDLAGREPALPAPERLYFLEAVRYVRRVAWVEAPASLQGLPEFQGPAPDIWVVDRNASRPGDAAWCRARKVGYRVLGDAALAGFPAPEPAPSGRPKVLVTGSFDWMHSGHVRFFEEVSALGELYVVVGHDRNIRLLKGEGHPMFPEQERRYLVGSLRQVHQALVSTGSGWLDAEPEIARIRPDRYAVNEDGDKPEKRAFCREHGIEYVVLRRVPKPGLTTRSSTQLRGW